MARISKLANPEFAKAVGLAYVDGWSREEMAAEFGVCKDTITVWCRDPRVQAPAARNAQERVLRISRKIDGEIDARLGDPEWIKAADAELLLKIRKEFLERALKIDLGKAGDAAQTTNDTIQAIEDNPNLAADLAALLQNAGKSKTLDHG